MDKMLNICIEKDKGAIEMSKAYKDLQKKYTKSRKLAITNGDSSDE